MDAFHLTNKYCILFLHHGDFIYQTIISSEILCNFGVASYAILSCLTLFTSLSFQRRMMLLASEISGQSVWSILSQSSSQSSQQIDLLADCVMNSTCIHYESSRPEYIHAQVLGNMHKTPYIMGKLQKIHIHLTPPLKLKVDP